MPMIGQRRSTRTMPPKKATMPWIRSGLEKKRIVRETPMVRVRPNKKRMSPKANIAESKRNRHPRNRKIHPKKSNPVPIFVLSLNMIVTDDDGRMSGVYFRWNDIGWTGIVREVPQ